MVLPKEIDNILMDTLFHLYFNIMLIFMYPFTRTLKYYYLEDIFFQCYCNFL